MSEINAKNIGQVINAAQGKIEQHNYYGKQLTLPNSVPSISNFVGREDYLSQLREFYKNGTRCFVLHGIGGVGKTALALQFAAEIAGEYKAKIFVDMQGLSRKPLSARDAMLDAARQFDHDVPNDISEAELESLFLSRVQNQPTLIFLDNAADEDSVEALKEAKACLIITSRRRIYLDEEPFEITAMTDDDAVKLLLDKGGRSRIGEFAAEIAKECGNLPLALNVVRSLLIKKRLLRVPELIENLKKDKLAQLSEVESSLHLSYANIGEQLQKRWRQLSVFPASFAPDAAAAVWEIDVPTAERMLEELESYSLIEFFPVDESAAETGGAGSFLRIRQHNLARTFATKRLSADADECFKAKLLFAKHYGSILVRAQEIWENNEENGFMEGLKLIDAEWVNILNGQKWLAEAPAPTDEIANLYANYSIYCWTFVKLRLSPRQNIKWQELGLQMARKVKNRQAESGSLRALGVVCYELGDYKKTIEYQEQALTIDREIKDRWGEVATLSNLGIVYQSLDKYPKAIEYYEQSLAIAREIKYRLGEGNALGNLGSTYNNLKEYRKAIEYHEQYLAIARDTGSILDEGVCLGGLAISYDALGEYQKAIEYHEQYLAIVRRVGDRLNEAISLNNLGETYMNLGEMKKACELWKQSIAIFETIESPHVNVVRNWLDKHCKSSNANTNPNATSG